MKRNLRRVGRFISIFYPRNIYKILAKLYSMTNDLSGTRTDEIIRIISDKKYKNYLEVGVWQRDNLLPIAEKFPDIICYGVDPYSAENYLDNVKLVNILKLDDKIHEKVYSSVQYKAERLNNIAIIRKTSKEAGKDFEDESLDIVFIDARHDYGSVIKDIKSWLPKVKSGGGVLCGHDYSLQFFGVIEAVNDEIGYDNVSIKSDATWFYVKI